MTAALAGATVVVSLVLMVMPGWLASATVESGFTPLRVFTGSATGVPVWATPLTATLIHAGLAHLILNMVMLGYCGRMVERAVGPGPLLFLYIIGAYAACAAQWALSPHSPSPMIGASGAISALVAAYALLYTEQRTPAVGPVPGSLVHVLWLAIAWIGIQTLTGLAGLGGTLPIAVGAHVGGFLAGLVLARPLLLWRFRHA